MSQVRTPVVVLFLKRLLQALLSFAWMFAGATKLFTAAPISVCGLSIHGWPVYGIASLEALLGVALLGLRRTQKVQWISQGLLAAMLTVATVCKPDPNGCGCLGILKLHHAAHTMTLAIMLLANTVVIAIGDREPRCHSGPIRRLWRSLRRGG